MKWLRKVLYPIVPIYYVVTWLRNALFDLGIKPSRTFSIPVICVGNLSVGGTGKTPMIEYLIRLLNKEYRVATLSRGYKRKTEGFKLADAADTADTAETIGDEPFQFFNKFGTTVHVAVDRDRVHGISELLKLVPQPELVLLDDAYQHRSVKAGFYVMLTTYINPFFKDIVLPTGDLREPRSGYKRANIIVVTKCPSTLTPVEKERYIKAIAPMAHQSVFFSTISYSETIFSNTKEMAIDTLGSFCLVTGIANAQPLVAFLKKKGLIFEHLNYKDHHDFTPSDLKLLERKDMILTTEKDYMRLKQHKQLEGKLFYLPITVALDAPSLFNKKVSAYTNASLNR